MLNNNPNKTVSACAKGMVISFTDSNKHHFVKFDKQNKKPVHRKHYQETEAPVFNNKQQKMYLEALYGLSVYPQEMVNRMPRNVVMKIITRCEIVQKVINRWKQEIVNQRVDRLLLNLFPKSPIVKAMVDVKGYDDTIKTRVSFKDLGVDEYKIARKLVDEKLLPQNFFNLV
jgi:hypothetical protein